MNNLKSINNIQKDENLRQLEKIQNILNFKINQNIGEILINFNVAKPIKTQYKNNNEDFVLNYLFGFSDKPYEDFIYNYKTYLGRIPNELYPIGSADGGNLVCIHKETSEIYFWFHEEDDWGMEGINKYPKRIAKDLNSFLDSLVIAELPTQQELDRAKNEGKTIYQSDDFDDIFAQYLIKK